MKLNIAGIGIVLGGFLLGGCPATTSSRPATNIPVASAHQLIAFVKTDVAGYDIWTLDLDGRGTKQLTTSGKCYYPSWTPDGKRIVFTNQEQIWVMNSDGTHATKLTSDMSWEYSSPIVSPDGDKILVHAIKHINDDQTQEELQTMNLDGSAKTSLLVEKLGGLGDVFQTPAFSPDGTYILYGANGSGMGEGKIFRYSLADKSKKLLYATDKRKTPYDCYAPAYSPDGKTIACRSAGSAGNGYRYGIVIMNSDGTDAKPIYTGFVSDRPVWSANGEKLYFSTRQSIEVLELKSGKKTVLLQMPNDRNPTINLPALQPLAAAKK